MSELNRINNSDQSGTRNPKFGKVFELPWRNEFLRLLYAYIIYILDDFSKLSIPKVKKDITGRHWRSNKKNYLSNSNSNTSKSYLSMQLSSKFSSKSYLSNAVSSNFFMLGSGFLGIHMGKSEKRKKLHGFLIGT